MVDQQKRDFLRKALLGSGALALTPSVLAHDSASRKEVRLYVGTYTSDARVEGIYVCRFDAASGAISLIGKAKGGADPSFLAVDRKGNYLFAVNELVEFEGRQSGSVTSFAIDKRSGNLTLINKQPSHGGAPCHISITDDGKFILVANYLGGNVAVFPVGRNGAIGPVADVAQHTGRGPNKDRQLSAHAHSITLDNRGRFAVSADLGIDKVMIYRFDRGRGRLVANRAQPYFPTKPGAGPRHFAFHPNGNLAFVVNELDSTVSSLYYDGNAGTLKEIETVSTLAPGFSGANTCADIHVSADGKFVYCSNRGSDSIAVLKIDERTGKLSYIENTPTGGKKPRNFSIDPTGNFLLAANQDTGNIVVFRIDRASGKLQNTGNVIEVPAPVCLKFVTYPS